MYVLFLSVVPYVKSSRFLLVTAVESYTTRPWCRGRRGAGPVSTHVHSGTRPDTLGPGDWWGVYFFSSSTESRS